MTSRRSKNEMPVSEFIERLRTEVENICFGYGVEMPVKVEVIRDERSFSLIVYVTFGSPTKLGVNWRVDHDCISLGFIDEAVAQFEEQIPTDARFTIEVPEWQLQNLVSKKW